MLTPREAAASFRVSPATAHRWWQRWRSASDRERAICDCRRQTGWGPRLVAGATGFAHSSVRKVLHRFGLSRPPRAQREPANSSRRGFARRTEPNRSGGHSFFFVTGASSRTRRTRRARSAPRPERATRSAYPTPPSTVERSRLVSSRSRRGRNLRASLSLELLAACAVRTSQTETGSATVISSFERSCASGTPARTASSCAATATP